MIENPHYTFIDQKLLKVMHGKLDEYLKLEDKSILNFFYMINDSTSGIERLISEVYSLLHMITDKVKEENQELLCLKCEIKKTITNFQGLADLKTGGLLLNSILKYYPTSTDDVIGLKKQLHKAYDILADKVKYLLDLTHSDINNFIDARNNFVKRGEITLNESLSRTLFNLWLWCFYEIGKELLVEDFNFQSFITKSNHIMRQYAISSINYSKASDDCAFFKINEKTMKNIKELTNKHLGIILYQENGHWKLDLSMTTELNKPNFINNCSGKIDETLSSNFGIDISYKGSGYLYACESFSEINKSNSINTTLYTYEIITEYAK
ncbi:hypothetical protein L3V83_15515 [Thiotrichales bacterium 19X7-9]|nr:hypothetical protein [Thiotrichales bacterium 19X7-9]